jgi:Protein of unknown function (DUF1573)
MFSKWAALLVILGVGSAALLGPNAASAQPNYLVSLGTGPANPPLGLNNNGQALLAKGIYSGGTFTPFPAGFTGSAINARGDVAGLTAAGDLALYSGGVVTDLAAPPGPPPMPGAPPNQFVFIGAINASDEIVGTMFDYADLDSGFIYSGGVLTPIRPVLNAHGAESEAQGLNDSGVVTGCQDSLPGYPNEAYSLANGIVTDLGPGCGAFVTPSGEIVGYGGGGGTAIFSSAGIELIPNSGPPTAVNSSGQIVGFTQAPNGQVIGFFYDGVVTDVNLLINASDPLKSSVTIDRAVGINDHRLLLLDGHDPLGNHQAYLLQAPWLDIAPGPLAFAAQSLGVASAPQVLTLTNSGTTPLSIDSISGTAEFTQSNTCQSPVAAGANCTVSVTFTPVSMAGDRTAILDVVTDGSTLTVPLSGSVAIAISLSASSAQPRPGASFTISWNATAGSTCNPSGGAPGDGWVLQNGMQPGPPPLPASGSASVIETAPGTYTYLMSCGVGSQSAVSKLVVTVLAPPSGGGGAIDLLVLFTLSGGLALRWMCTRRARDS